jgi:catechol 2,3-dioxygenase-like lactoylglutathione lyase family enzyme
VIHHVALEVLEGDAQACVAFWELLGFTEVQPPGTLRERSRWVERAGTQVHLLFAGDPVVAPEGHVAVVAPEYERTLAGLRAAGFEPDLRTEHWGSPRCFVGDPAGHRVEIMRSPPS